MTKEELKKEAEEWLVNNLHSTEEDYKQAYLTGAEPREKRIADLEDKLANADYQLEGRDNEIRELKAQIEKMKCDVLSLIKDRMNDDIDQNIIERLAEKWEIKEK